MPVTLIVLIKNYDFKHRNVRGNKVTIKELSLYTYC